MPSISTLKVMFPYFPPFTAGKFIPNCWLCGKKGTEPDGIDYTRVCEDCDVVWLSRASTKDGHLPRAEHDYMMWLCMNGERERLNYVDFSQPGPPHCPA